MIKRMLTLAALSCLLAAAPAGAANFLKIGDIKGESTDKEHKDWIDIGPWSWGVQAASSSTGGTGGGSAKPMFDDFAWMQGADSSVVPLFLAVAQGTHYQEATLDVTRFDPKESNSYSFFQMVFGNVAVQRLNLNGSGTDISAESAIGYDTVTMRYRTKDGKGYGPWVEGRFDLKKNMVNFSGDPLVIRGLLESGGSVSLNASVPLAVPEPASWALLGIGVLAVAAAVRRRRTA